MTHIEQLAVKKIKESEKYLKAIVIVLVIAAKNPIVLLAFPAFFLYKVIKIIFDAVRTNQKNNEFIQESQEQIIYSKEDIVALLDDQKETTTQEIIEVDAIYKDLIESYKLHNITLNAEYTHEIYTSCVVYMCTLEKGTKLAKVKNLCADIARDIKVKSVTVSQRQEQVVFEITIYSNVQLLRVKSLLQSDVSKDHLTLKIGKYVDDEIATITLDASSPHILACGTTGSGKSVLLHTMITCAITEYLPSELNLQLIDTKMIELTAYEDIEHTKALAITAKEADCLLKSLVIEMENRYSFMRELKVRSISDLDQCTKPPFILVVCDELGDLMMSEYKTDITSSIIKLAQKARAAGIHLVLATQKPHSSILSTTIKACLSTRIALKVSSRRDSMMILDCIGAEALAERGDFIISKDSKTKIGRATYIQKEEHEKILSFLKNI